MPILLDEIIDIRALRKAVNDGYVAVKKDSISDLHILNYTPEAQYENVWTPETRACRGLITSAHPFESCATVVARPFPKFFNLSQYRGPHALPDSLPIKSNFEVSEKLDGSLAIAFIDPISRLWRCATRGSFESDQAVRASILIQDKRFLWAPEIKNPDITYLFEYVAPTNRIVVPYGKEELVLIAAIDNYGGIDIPLKDLEEVWPGRVAQRFRYRTIEELEEHVATAKVGHNAEGYVVRFAPRDATLPSTRVKLKFEEYIRLHRIVTGLSTTSIWETLSSGGSVEDLLAEVPDEFFDFVEETSTQLKRDFAKALTIANTVADLASMHSEVRKEQAQYIFSFLGPAPPIGDFDTSDVEASKFPSGLVFAALDKKPNLDEQIWRYIKPKWAVPGQFDPDAD